MGSNLRDFLEGRLLWFGELVLCGSGPWIIRWLGRLLLRLDQRSVLHAGVGGGLGDLDGGVTDGGAEIVHVELVAASPLPVSVCQSRCTYRPLTMTLVPLRMPEAIIWSARMP